MGEHCVCCGDVIPEGRPVCSVCEGKISQQPTFGGDPQLRAKYKKALYDVIAKIYAKHPVGGALHIVLDDLNVNDKCIQWCIEDMDYPIYTVADRQLFSRCAELLLMLKSQRARTLCILKAFDKIYKGGDNL